NSEADETPEMPLTQEAEVSDEDAFLSAIDNEATQEELVDDYLSNPSSDVHEALDSLFSAVDDQLARSAEDTAVETTELQVRQQKLKEGLQKAVAKRKSTSASEGPKTMSSRQKSIEQERREIG